MDWCYGVLVRISSSTSWPQLINFPSQRSRASDTGPVCFTGLLVTPSGCNVSRSSSELGFSWYGYVPLHQEREYEQMSNVRQDITSQFQSIAVDLKQIEEQLRQVETQVYGQIEKKISEAGSKQKVRSQLLVAK